MTHTTYITEELEKSPTMNGLAIGLGDGPTKWAMHSPGGKAVVVQSGARDAYQLAVALSEAGLLETLVTDLYWPTDSRAASAILKLLPRRAQTLLKQRSHASLPSAKVKLCGLMGLATLLADKLPRVPLSFRRRMTRAADAELGRTAGKHATRTGAALVSYSYYGYDAFRHCARPGMLFQMHPHPASMRRILTEELEAHPDCAASLRQEWELALPETDYQHLVRETEMASRFLVASSFTRHTLIEHGTSADAISVVPYGVDSARFGPANVRKDKSAKLRLLFVGRINQRKGIKYLLNAIEMVGAANVHLTVCGRVVDGLELFRPFGSLIEVRPSVSAEELVAHYQAADLFVFPSVAEGFGQVLLEAMACGLPILSTTHTAAPDLIENGREGFIVEPRHAEQIAERIEWALSHRAELESIGVAARQKAEVFTWGRFRRGAAETVRNFLLLSRTEDPWERSHV